MSPYRQTAMCGATRRHWPDNPCCRSTGHRGAHRGRIGAPWPNRERGPMYVRYVPPHKREEAARRAANYAAYFAALELTQAMD